MTSSRIRRVRRSSSRRCCASSRARSRRISSTSRTIRSTSAPSRICAPPSRRSGRTRLRSFSRSPRRTSAGSAASVMHEPSRSESVPWVFFKDGVRELTLTQGIEDDELVSLLRILQRVRNAAPEEDDLLTLMWEQEFTRLKYRFVDINLDSHASFDASRRAAEGAHASDRRRHSRRGGSAAGAQVRDRAHGRPRRDAVLPRRKGDRLPARRGRGRADGRHAAQRARDSARHFRGAGE